MIEVDSLKVSCRLRQRKKNNWPAVALSFKFLSDLIHLKMAAIHLSSRLITTLDSRAKIIQKINDTRRLSGPWPSLGMSCFLFSLNVDYDSAPRLILLLIASVPLGLSEALAARVYLSVFVTWKWVIPYFLELIQSKTIWCLLVFHNVELANVHLLSLCH